MSPAKLSKFLINPGKLANIINWNKRKSRYTVCLDVADRIGLALASHDNNTNAVHKLNSLPYKFTPRTRKTNLSEVTSAIRALIREHPTCGFLVNWPLESDGRFGKDCGKALHLLDHLAEQNVLNGRRPFALWDARKSIAQSHNVAFTTEEKPDEWGRLGSFSLKAPQGLEYYKHGENVSMKKVRSIDSRDAVTVMNSFIDAHFRQKHFSPVAALVLTQALKMQLDGYVSNGAYIQAQLL